MDKCICNPRKLSQPPHDDRDDVVEEVATHLLVLNQILCSEPFKDDDHAVVGKLGLIHFNLIIIKFINVLRIYNIYK